MTGYPPSDLLLRNDFLENIRTFKPDHAKQIDKILLDEERHAKYSLTFAKKNNSKLGYFKSAIIFMKWFVSFIRVYIVQQFF